MNPADLLLRPAGPDDLPALERMAAASATGITTLPTDSAALRERLQRSAQAFASSDDASGEEIHLFVLEDHGVMTPDGRPRIVGSSGIAASAGFADRFYTYRNEMVVHASHALGASNRIHTLHLCHDLTGHTLLTSFYIEPAYEHTLAPQLLSRARLLFIAEFAERFSDRIAAESPGLADDTGRCPFWDAVGRRFFDMDYPAVEQLTGGRSKAYIAELMPHAPIHVPLLPEAAQWAIGQLHPVAELPFSILMDEGFDSETYIDIFDGGPTVDARLHMLKSVRRSRHVGWDPGDGSNAARAAGPVDAEPAWHIVTSTLRSGFRALLRRIPAGAAALALPAQDVLALGAVPGQPLRVAPLEPAGHPCDSRSGDLS